MKKLKFETTVESFELMNNDYIKATINVCHRGKNRNKSDFTDSAMKTIEESILCKPVICEYQKDKQRIGGHGGKTVLTDSGVEFIETTYEVGFVDPRTKPYYKQFTETDGMTLNEYLCVDVILWGKRHPYLYEEIKKGLAQSFEIEVGAGYYREQDDYIVVEEANVLALCLLGDTEPCFSASRVNVKYSLEERTTIYKEMVDTFLKQFAFEGGEDMEDVKTVEETIETEVVSEEIVEETVENAQDETVVEIEVHEVEEVVEQETVEQEIAEEQPIEIEEIETTEEEIDVVDFEGKYNELQVEYGKVVTELESMLIEFNELKQFKLKIELEQRKCAEDELFSKFESLHNDADFIALREKSGDYSLEELENMCYMMVGRKALSFSKKETKSKQNTKLKIENENKKPDIYGGLLD